MPGPRPRRPNLTKLIDDLSSADAARRESAAARLTIAGQAAVQPLRALVATDEAAADARVAALRTLAGIGGAHAAAADAAVATLAGPVDALALEGIDVLRTMLDEREDETAATTALEHLTRIALSAAAPVERRRAAIDALSGLPEPLLRPILEAVASDADPALAARGRATRRQQGATLADVLADGQLPDPPAAMSALIDAAGSTVPVTDLRRVIELVRAREQREAEAGHDDRRAAWRLIRGQVHRALGDRDSQVALYDLRETLEEAEAPVTVDFLAAAMKVGDENCLDGLAAQWVAAGTDRWLRDQLELAVRSIVNRKALTRADPVFVRLLGRLPAAGPLVAIAPKRRRLRSWESSVDG